MTRPLRFGEPASEEFRDAVHWYESRRPGLGADLFDAVTTEIEAIQANPEIGTQRSSDGKTRRVLLDRFGVMTGHGRTPSRATV